MAKSFPHSFEVCNCHKVTLGEIVYVVKEKGAKSLDDLAKLTDAGTCCKCCVDASCDIGEEKMQLYLTQILNKFNK
ncbi:(2Fe-2S)-binding protein [Arcobacter sp. CECT 8985]|uniref:(2Fe-2S)-binding protein n=1 Tax=Arcobacter sp. CECT 8985 TaxID=1935424 RepID=UPI00100C2F35|nr:(2Fe-2S)-binding protein [Arcobacter sp. CECT 8985]RXJ86731.1 (2Fe-2S)-binding protein [Arcobacter sp. CECT 8985]